MIWLLLGGSVLGALCRYYLSRSLQRRASNVLPLGTFVVNIMGSFILGMLAAALQHVPAESARELQLVLGTGFCGTFTTFSSFALDVVLGWNNDRQYAMLHMLIQPIIGLCAVWLGFALMGGG